MRLEESRSIHQGEGPEVLPPRMAASSEYPVDPPRQVTDLLLAWRNGEQAALSNLIPLVYGEMRRLAQHKLSAERADHTLQATALVHETYLRLFDKDHPQWQDRAHFFAVAATVMRRILIDHARGCNTARRGTGVQKIALEEGAVFSDERAAELIALDDCLQSLALLDPRKSRLVELRFFGGLSIKETAAALDLSTATVIREWRLARAWLHRALLSPTTPQATLPEA